MLTIWQSFWSNLNIDSISNEQIVDMKRRNFLNVAILIISILSIILSIN